MSEISKKNSVVNFTVGVSVCLSIFYITFSVFQLRKSMNKRIQCIEDKILYVENMFAPKTWVYDFVVNERY